MQRKWENNAKTVWLHDKERKRKGLRQAVAQTC